MTRQFSRSSARLTEPSPSTRPSALDMPKLVVASASKPTDASSFAVPASHGFGRIKIPGRWCNSRNRRPFSTWVRMTVSPDYRANTGLAAPTGKCNPANFASGRASAPPRRRLPPGEAMPARSFGKPRAQVGGHVPSPRGPPGEPEYPAAGVGGIASPWWRPMCKTHGGASLTQLYTCHRGSSGRVFETRVPELTPIRRNPGFRNAIEPLNRTMRIRADAAGGFNDSACAPEHSVAFLHGFAALTQTCQWVTCGGRRVHYTFRALLSKPVYQTSPR